MAKKELEEAAEKKQLTCGLIMPISAIDGCTVEHWVEVKNIICDAVSSIEIPSFISKLVSDQDDVGVIQKRIVQNVYSSDIVICDVSCKNANVMFELGMRLAFDKPTILIKDDKTDFSFDTGVIEHLVYPRDLRFSKIVGFKKVLAEKIVATYKAFKEDPDHTTFLKNFGSFKVASVSQTVGTADEVMLEMMADLHREVSNISRRVAISEVKNPYEQDERVSPQLVSELMPAIETYKILRPGVNPLEFIGDHEFYSHLTAGVSGVKRFKTYRAFVKAVDDFMLSNQHLFNS